MPFKSKAQQRWMFSQHPAMARKWAEHTPNLKSLPEMIGNESKTRKRSKIRGTKKRTRGKKSTRPKGY